MNNSYGWERFNCKIFDITASVCEVGKPFSNRHLLIFDHPANNVSLVRTALDNNMPEVLRVRMTGEMPWGVGVREQRICLLY